MPVLNLMFVFFFRSFGLVSDMLRGKAQYARAEFERRGFPLLFAHLLGILDTLRPAVFDAQHTSALNGILAHFLEFASVCSNRSFHSLW